MGAVAKCQFSVRFWLLFFLGGGLLHPNFFIPFYEMLLVIVFIKQFHYTS